MPIIIAALISAATAITLKFMDNAEADAHRDWVTDERQTTAQTVLFFVLLISGIVTVILIIRGIFFK